ncbi:unnamed protein product [Ostreobium quekettii]|uniref:Protein MON2 homolog n=1 Tax=Ostreobium quekettii TaxID=121088 RepID=A0A8S1IYS9_9CHLO|nr:unnamed protein product [Ostreobium quekettii]|eukprot:evm.model.scf_153.4 EVM.evm.TU.scf_153.4   scf_153:32048-42358(+)
MAKNTFMTVLESDLRVLSTEARKSDGLAGQLAGWLNNSEQTAVKDAAERAVMRLRAFSREPNCLEAIRGSKDVLRPFVLACETKNSRLTSHALGCIQRLLANDAVSAEGRVAVITVLQHLEKSHDEGVKLKMLQTALTLLQNPAASDREENICNLLGLNFRLLAHPRNTETVVSTAAATVRQAVTLVFDRALAEDDAIDEYPSSEEERRLSHSQATGSGREIAALHLLEDMCEMCSGSPATWLQSPVVQRQFILDMLEYVLSHKPQVFHRLPLFEEALRERVCHVLDSLLMEYMQHDGEPARTGEVRAAFRSLATTLENFYTLIPAKVAHFLDILFKGTSAGNPTWRRTCCLQVLRHLSLDRYLVYYLYTTYDMKMDFPNNACHNLVEVSVAVVQRFLKLHPDDGDGTSMAVLGSLYKATVGQSGWSVDIDANGVGEAYLAAMGLDAIISIVGAIEALAEKCGDGGDYSVASPQAPGTGYPIIKHNALVSMVDDLWRMVLGAFKSLLLRGCGDDLLPQLIKGYQSMLQTCASLHVNAAMGAFLTSLCDLSLPALTAVDVTPHGGVAAGSPWGTVLKPMNIQALHALFNIAYLLGNSLGSSWVLVVRTLHAVDQILLSPHTTTQEANKDVASAGQATELSVLSAAVTRVFEGSALLNPEAVISLLAALRDVSSQTLQKSNRGPMRLFALSRMVDVLLHNVHRIQDLWGIFLSHIVEVLSSSDAAVRTAATSELNRAVTGALGLPLRSEDGESDDGEEEATPQDEAPSMAVDKAVEHMILVALESLYQDVGHSDVRRGILQIAILVLQRNGDFLTRGWSPILRLLESVPMSGDEMLISTAFQSIELLMNDYFALTVPKDLHLKCLEVTALYGTQMAAVNVSLTTVRVLWDATDTFRQLPGPSEQHPSDGSVTPQLSSENSASIGTVGDDELLVYVFSALQRLSMDRRPEVRSSGIKTFFAVISSFGNQMSLELWERCLRAMVLPLLKSVYNTSITSSSEEAQAEVLGREGGKSVTMLVHHSRNTERKLWDETLVLALGGMSKLLRAHLPKLVQLDDFLGDWKEIIQLTEDSVARAAREVVSAGIGLMTMVVQTFSSSDILTSEMLQCLFGALRETVRSMTSSQASMPTAARVEMVQGIGQMYSSLKERLGTDEVVVMMGWLDRFVRYPMGPKDTSMHLPGCLPSVQRAVLKLMAELAALQSAELWPIIIRTLCDFLEPPGLAVPPVLQGRNEGRESAPDALSSDFMEQAVDELVRVYCEQAPYPIRVALFNPVVAALARCMVSRYVSFEKGLWSKAAAAFNTVVTAGLPAINIASSGGGTVQQSPWEVLAAAFEAFLLGKGMDVEIPDKGHRASGSSSDSMSLQALQILSPRARIEASRGDSEVRMTVLDTLGDVVLTACEHASLEMRTRLVRIVDEGMTRSDPSDGALAAGGRFSHACLRKMYVLCSRGEAGQDPHGALLEVAQLALPIFISRCDRILRTFAQDDRQSGTIRLPAAQIDEVVFTLEILSSLTLDPRVVEGAFVTTPAQQELISWRPQREEASPLAGSTATRGRAHLLFLYQSLCDCITCKDTRVRGMVRDLLVLVGVDLGLFMPPSKHEVGPETLP